MATKTMTVRLTESDKKADPANYILNPQSGKCVKRDSAKGKELVAAEQAAAEGKTVEVSVTITETQKLMLVVNTLIGHFDLDVEEVKASLLTIQQWLPRNFPSEYGGKKKQDRPEGFPKGAKNAYIIYVSENREEYAKEHGLDPREATSRLGGVWSGKTKLKDAEGKFVKDAAGKFIEVDVEGALTEEEKEPYYEKAEEDKARHEQEMKEYAATHPDFVLKAPASSKPKSKPSKVTAYQLYCKENRDQLKDEAKDLPEAKRSGAEITKLLASKWKALKDKSVYEAQAVEANKDFAQRMEVFLNSPEYELSESEQKKANDPRYELNLETGRFALKEVPKTGTRVSKKSAVGKPTVLPQGISVLPKPAKALPKPVTRPVTRSVTKSAVAENKKVLAVEDEEVPKAAPSGKSTAVASRLAAKKAAKKAEQEAAAAAAAEEAETQETEIETQQTEGIMAGDMDA